ncbi:glycosyltransferase [Ligilactobacillus salivarius]|uniref:Glycosyltransferase n=1 Tax=Ligilactobacillus salivarius TaxID=1624 RepID=A0ABD7YVH2_9LACO|nr:glycosyltransferase [Ligilactobacillus salivarius]WHS05718.1 glycosyltransferase [Ligilactobacillus salivarius]WHS08204.1 glycosyltransferase [Ligilactobacillus salivarius]WHS09631.1 glycosyltransferase [Ligilactobacillus salivarius]WHS13569.1 glycosyltransferase [Ligilactobacillus salivarius]WHS17814.1 glycosyltransferase [Ligilactobacillus salivarius]
MKLSIVMTTYNGIRYIEEQLESIVNQERKADEVLIFDDGSNDGTPEFIEKYIIKNKLNNTWKVIVNEENKGWRRNFVEGIWSSTGDLVFPCDQDDIWHKDKLKVMEDIMINNPQIKVLTTNVTNLYDNSKREQSSDQNEKLEKVSWAKHIFKVDAPGCVFCIRKEIVEKSKNYYNLEYAHDDYFWKLGLFADGLYNYNKDMIDYRRHDDSTFSVEVRKNRNSEARIKWINMALDYCKDLTDYVKDDDTITEKDKKLKIIERNRKYLNIRNKFYKTGNPLLIVPMSMYKDCYLQSRQLLGDIYIKYTSK